MAAATIPGMLASVPRPAVLVPTLGVRLWQFMKYKPYSVSSPSQRSAVPHCPESRASRSPPRGTITPSLLTSKP
ncbi:hypothetical protein D3C81_1814350 [compost metagenome]